MLSFLYFQLKKYVKLSFLCDKISPYLKISIKGKFDQYFYRNINYSIGRNSSNHFKKLSFCNLIGGKSIGLGWHVVNYKCMAMEPNLI